VKELRCDVGYWKGMHARAVFGSECVMPGRGLSPWQVNQRFALELGPQVLRRVFGYVSSVRPPHELTRELKQCNGSKQLPRDRTGADA